MQCHQIAGVGRVFGMTQCNSMVHSSNEKARAALSFGTSQDSRSQGSTLFVPTLQKWNADASTMKWSLLVIGQLCKFSVQ